MSVDLSSFALWDAIGANMSGAVIATDIEGVVQVWSNGAAKLYGWSREEAIGQSINDLTVGPVERQIAAEIMSQVASGVPWEGDFHARTKLGEILNVHVIDMPVCNSVGETCGIVGLSFNVAKQHGEGVALVEIREIAKAINEARLLERSLAARIVHDDVGQLLSIARSETLGIVEACQNEESEQHESLMRLVDLIDRALGSARGLATDLKRGGFDIWTLLLRGFELAELMQQRTSILVQVNIRNDVSVLRDVGPGSALVAYDILREALMNCERHSGACHVGVSIAVKGESLVLEVEDDGCGIPANSCGTGIGIMQDRIKQVRGELEIRNLKDAGSSGTKLVARIPRAALVCGIS